jgi:hypothetical protein
LTTPHQRFCPLCDTAFSPGEAVLRCSGCELLHHPGCWVRHGGCAGQDEHEGSPQAIAYEARPATTGDHPAPATTRPERSPAPPPIEIASRIAPPPPRQDPFSRAPGPGADDHETGAGDAERRAGSPAAAQLRLVQVATMDEPVIGAPPRPRAPYNPQPPEALGASKGHAQGHEPGMPRIYGRHGLLAYWYYGAAGLLAIAVAVAVVWGVDRLVGRGSSAAVSIPTATSAEGEPAAPRETAAAVATSAAPAGSQKFRAGDRATVQGTGDCLNVRSAAGRANPAIACLRDGEQVTISGGPEAKDGLQWWKVKTAAGDGWAAEDYLAPR